METEGVACAEPDADRENGKVITPGCSVLIRNLERETEMPIHISDKIGLGEKMIKPGPAAEAVLGHRKGDVVDICLNGRPVPHKILEIN